MTLKQLLFAKITMKFSIRDLMLTMLMGCFVASVIGLNLRCRNLAHQNRVLSYEIKVLYDRDATFRRAAEDYIRRLEALENYRER
jgi:hypothetical protein